MSGEMDDGLTLVDFRIVMFCYVFFFFNDTATTEIYTLSLHDALPIFFVFRVGGVVPPNPSTKTHGKLVPGYIYPIG